MQSITISIPDLKIIIQEAIRWELENFKLYRQAKSDDDLLTRKEAARILKIDLSTLHLQTKAGRLKTEKLGRRVYYRRSQNTLLAL